MIQQGDGTFAKREKLGQCVRCAVAISESECKICGLKIGAKPSATASYVTKLSHGAKPEGYRIHELKVENKKGHAFEA